MPPRGFPPPWDIEEYDRSCFIVRDNKGQALAYVYFENEKSRRAKAHRSQYRQAAGAAEAAAELTKPDHTP
jgi:hypothetical protein